MKNFGLILLTLIVSLQVVAQTPETNARSQISGMIGKRVLQLNDQDLTNTFKIVTDLAVTRTPFMTMSELRQGKADTARVVHVNDNLRVFTYRYDPTSNAADDSATVIRNGNRRYVIVSDIITPQMFSVTTDGTDQSSKLRKAILGAYNRKKPFYLGEGTYTGYVSFSNLDGLKIYGSGPGTVWKLPNNSNQTIFKCKTCSNVTISDLKFDGNAANNTTRQTSDNGENNVNDNIYISRGNNIRVERTHHINSTGNGINGYKVVYVHLDYNIFYSCNRLDQNHITVQFGFTDEVSKDNGGSISFNVFDGNPTGFGMSCFSGHELIVQGNIARNCLVAYGSEYGGSKNTLVDNKSFDCGKGAVLTSTEDFVRRGEYNILSRNQFLRCTSPGTGMVQLAGQNYLTFSDCVITGAAGNTNVGVYAVGVRDSNIHDLRVSGMGSDGIFFPTGTTTSQRVKIHHCASYSNGGNGFYFVSCDRFSIDNNEAYNNAGVGIKDQLATRHTITNNFIYDTQTTPTQQYGILLQDCSDVTEEGNTFSFQLFQPDVNLQGTITRHHVISRINLQRSRASAIPTTGSWGIGDVVTNSNPTKGKPTGWRCVTAGTPGSWEIIGIYGATVLNVTAAEKAAMTAREGDVVMQTDGTKGMYQFLSGAWVAL